MSEEKKKPSKPKLKKAIAKKNLATEKNGNVKKGSECECTEKEYKIFKERGAV